MNRELKMSYETMGSSSYMVVTCPPEIELVNYELEMVLSNEIKNFLAVSRQMLNGETVLYYNITSRLPLSQVLEKRKLNRKELFHLIDGAILAIRDAAAFRLPQEGIVLEPEYVYVNPASCDPAFLFVPMQEPNGTGIKELLLNLVLNDKIEMAADNFIQVLLAELNRRPFSLEGLEKSLIPYCPSKQETAPVNPAHRLQGVPGKPDCQGMPPQTSPQGEPQHQSSYQPMIPQSVTPQPAAPQIPVRQIAAYPDVGENQPGKKEELSGKAGKRPGMPGLPKGKKAETKKKTGKKPRENKQEERAGDGDFEFDPETAKKKFLLPQALVMVAAAGSISFGLFTDKDGNIVLNNILAFVILIALVEVILYREIYVNGKKPKKKEKKAAEARKPSHEKRAEKPTAPSREERCRPTPPHQDPPQVMMRQRNGQQTAPSQQLSAAAPQRSEPQPEASWQTAPRQSVPYQPAVSQASPYTGTGWYDAGETDVGGETELWTEEGENGTSAYLEYYENGRLSRIPLDTQAGVLVGRLKTEVDFAVKSPRVGKVHAKFYRQDGQYYVIDINSKNGTYINGSRTRIESNIPYPLCDKDRITLADSEFTIRCSER